MNETQLVPNRAFKIVFSINLLLTLIELFVNQQIKLFVPVDFIHQHKLLKTNKHRYNLYKLDWILWDNAI